jgi:transcriptional regulator with XRE-family HTH domain
MIQGKETTRDPSDNNGAASNGLHRPMHRLATVRQQQGVSQRNVARRLNVDAADVRQQEAETTDLPLSLLYEWQKVLEVPIADLLVESNAALSPPVLERARMVRIMKTVASIVEKANTPPLNRLVQMLSSQLLEIMPELGDVTPWPSIGERRTLEECGRILERQVSDNVFRRKG